SFARIRHWEYQNLRGDGPNSDILRPLPSDRTAHHFRSRDRVVPAAPGHASIRELNRIDNLSIAQTLPRLRQLITFRFRPRLTGTRRRSLVRVHHVVARHDRLEHSDLDRSSPSQARAQSPSP